MHVIVTGGCGFKGSVLVDELLLAGYDVTVIDAQWFGNHLPEHPNLTVLHQDIRNLTSLPEADVMIHLAAVANDPAALLDPKLSWEVNVLATHNLLELCKKHGIRQFLYASSGSVYGVKEEEHVTEDLELVPISEYNKTKMIAERVVLSHKEDLIVTNIRPATVCGVSPRIRLDVAVNALTYSALSKGVITVFGGDQIRPNVHIKDITRAYMWAMHNPGIVHGQTYNVGFENKSLLELADIIKHRVLKRTGKPVEVEIEPSNDPRSYRVNSDKILKAGFFPAHGIVDAVEDIITAWLEGGFENYNIDQCYNMAWMVECKIK